MTGSGAVRRQYAALPYCVDEENRPHVLLITSRGTGRWVLPKGWPDGAETGPQTAAREAMEEAGVVGRIEPPQPIGSYPYVKGLKHGGPIRCRVTVFGLLVQGFSPDFREKGQRVLRWCAPACGAELVHEPELARLLLGFSRSVRKAKIDLGSPLLASAAESPEENELA